MAFVHLHTHSEYSLLDGANRIPDLLDRVQALGMDSLAITDHGNLHGAWAFYAEAKARKIRPILGFEAYLAFGSRHARETAGRRPPGGAVLAPRAAGEKPDRLSEPHPALIHWISRGLLPPAAHRQRNAGAAPRGDHRARRLPLRGDRAVSPPGELRRR